VTHTRVGANCLSALQRGERILHDTPAAQLSARPEPAALLEHRLFRRPWANNLLLFIDLVLLPRVDLQWARSLSALAAISLLLYGFIWEADRP